MTISGKNDPMALKVALVKEIARDPDFTVKLHEFQAEPFVVDGILIAIADGIYRPVPKEEIKPRGRGRMKELSINLSIEELYRIGGEKQAEIASVIDEDTAYIGHRLDMMTKMLDEAIGGKDATQ